MTRTRFGRSVWTWGASAFLAVLLGASGCSLGPKPDDPITGGGDDSGLLGADTNPGASPDAAGALDTSAGGGDSGPADCASDPEHCSDASSSDTSTSVDAAGDATADGFGDAPADAHDGRDADAGDAGDAGGDADAGASDAADASSDAPSDAADGDGGGDVPTGG